jgi:translation initiation factor 5B
MASNSNTNDFSDNSDDDNILQNDTVKKDKKKKKKNKSNAKPVAKQSAMGKLAQERLQKIAEEEARIKALEEEENRKIREEEQRLENERLLIEQEKALKKKAKEDRILAQKQAGTFMTKSQKEKIKKNKLALERLTISGMKTIDGKLVVEQIDQLQKTDIIKEKEDDDLSSDEEINFRSVISCIMGHVDTGKTKLLDKIRGTNVQDGEAGGITQQIGATFIPKETLLEKTSQHNFEINVPGLLMIDTPGHEAFSNLRIRGSSLCDIAIVVVDLVHGLEPQTIESIKILEKSGTKFIIALNKVDRLYGWKTIPNNNICSAFEIQDENCKSEFSSRLEKIIVQIMELGLNAKLYWENDSIIDTIPICPTSAITGEGISDLLMCLVKYSQEELEEEITFTDDFKCIIMESSLLEGFGSAIDVILINGELCIGDKIIVSTTDGTVETTVRNILTPPPNRESRIKSEYIHHKSLSGAIGIKIIANNLSKVIAGTPVQKITNYDEKETLLQQALENSNNVEKVELESEGVTVHASTMGSLEALLTFLRKECDPPIPVAQINIGKVMKKDVTKTFLSNEKCVKEYCTILAFNVEVDEDAIIEAKKCGVQIFTAEIIYHLFDQFKKHKETLEEIRKEEARKLAVFPCILKIMPECIFNKKNPLVLGVEVIEGSLHLGTPLSVPGTKTYIGKVIGIQNNKKDIEIGKKGMSICIKIDNDENPNIMYGRQFDDKQNLCSKISRSSIDILKMHFKKEISKDDVQLLVKLKTLYGIQ